jgi:uncharacterized delta-60 repeat protein
MRVSMGRAVVAIALALALIAPGAAGASRPDGALDPTFGDGGVLRLSAEEAFTVYGAAARAGRILVGGGHGVRVLDRRGHLDRGFGGDGSLDLLSAAGARFAPRAVAVDPRGRLLVLGDSVFPESENPSPPLGSGLPAFTPEVVRILRFLPDGKPDPTFGHGGVVETDLGLPPPVGTDGETLGPHPSIQATGIAVSPEGQIVVTGSAVIGLGEACEHDIFSAVGISAGWVARLTSGGVPDPTFGTDGLVGGHERSENPLGAAVVGEPVVGPDGEITYRSTGIDRCDRGGSHFGIARLTPDGQTDPGFGHDGAFVGFFTALASGSGGSLFALEQEFGDAIEPVMARVLRVAADGRPDHGFGHDGRATVRLGRSQTTILDALAVDGRGRILVGGTIGARKGHSIALLRISARGRWEQGFGPHGRVATQVRQLARSGPTDLFFDARGRLVALSRFEDQQTRHDGLVVARYRLRR